MELNNITEKECKTCHQIKLLNQDNFRLVKKWYYNECLVCYSKRRSEKYKLMTPEQRINKNKKQKELYQSNRSAILKKQQYYYSLNKVEIKKKRRQFYYDNISHKKEQSAYYYKKHRYKRISKYRESILSLSDSYIITRIADMLNINKSLLMIDPFLIEAKRQQLIIHRLCKKKFNSEVLLKQ